ncbi:manganese efflux pump [Campylobacter sp. RM12327]|uniref:manganese efflux pump MntP n=1 Tax=Campylobacter sputorum TaxID=206 RepID=UPI000B773899|nr:MULTISPECIES: manganese efflux pump MntP family protein [Campylobacter]ASM39629.1 hypothetical membrane protein (DUF204 domain) [Campylobacter sputorum]MBE7358331.1 manganese efflux pump [Campylobacter sp. RM11302]MBF6669493.1 manganese efflux pump [Campylobacter sp. RM12327]MBF6674764.1 manganese efflux pump [Campylobacter sp. RM13538]MBF6676399.1 manganese efflux pump [Campylobacter sp. RM12321]
MEIFLIAFALAMDSVALSMASGSKCNFKFNVVLKMAFIYGFFQALMPFFGYILGLSFVNFIEKIDHFVAFLILSFLGIKMMKESFQTQDKNEQKDVCTKDFILGGIATSIDAMAVGITFSFEENNIFYLVLIIGIVCFILCIIAFYIGKKIGEILESKAVFLGGLILILIGTKILLTHLGILSL